MRNCFVPKCDFRCRNQPRRMMFLAPKDDKMFQLWREILPKKREFKNIDKVCERHFVKDAILTTFDHVINGQLLQMERGRPRLKPDAIPTLNLECDETPVKRSVGKNTPRKLTKKAQHKISANDEAPDEIAMEEPSPAKRKGEYFVINEIAPIPTKNLLKTREVDDKEEGISSMEPPTADPLPQFELLYDEIFEVTLPSMLWGVHREPERQYIAFTCFDIARMQSTKSVALASNGCLKIALNGRIISEQYFSDELTAEFLSNVLNEVDETRFCLNWYEAKECALIAASGSQLCTSCS